MLQKTFRVKTPRHSLGVNAFLGFIDVKDVVVKKKIFLEMCKSGCPNYDKKFSCPPFSPSFVDYVKKSKLLVVMFACSLDQLEYQEYHKLRVGNAVLKSRLERVMRSLEDKYGGKFLGTGACRLCKPCRRKVGEACRYPSKMRFSLEALGVDVNALTSLAFGKKMLWYKDKTAPLYTSCVCALPVEKETYLNDILHYVSECLSNMK